MHRSRLVLACIAVHCVLPADRPTRSTGAQVGTAARRSPPVALRYVANAGVLLTISGADILIDAPIRDGIPPYATSSVAERERLEKARAPYDRVAAILITHWHEDHFDARAVAAHLAANARAVLISAPDVVDRVRAVAPALELARLRAVLPAPGTSDLVRLGPLPIRVLRIRHNPTRRLPEQHVGFLVGEPTAVLHTGDADPAADNFALLCNLPPVDRRSCRSGSCRATTTGGLSARPWRRAALPPFTCRHRMRSRCDMRSRRHAGPWFSSPSRAPQLPSSLSRRVAARLLPQLTWSPSSA